MSVSISEDAVEAFWKVASLNSDRYNAALVSIYVVKYPVKMHGNPADEDEYRVEPSWQERHTFNLVFAKQDFLNYNYFLREIKAQSSMVRDANVAEANTQEETLYKKFELGFASHIHLLNLKEEIVDGFHVVMKDFITKKMRDLRMIEAHHDLLSSGNSFHGYQRGLADETGFAFNLQNSLICKEPIDTAWVGYSLRNKYSVLRFTHIHKERIKYIQVVTSANVPMAWRNVSVMHRIMKQNNIINENKINSNYTDITDLVRKEIQSV